MATDPLSDALRGLRRVEVLRELADATDGQLLTRFLGAREETAFEALVRRHGPMVFGVCRRVLGHAQDAEDAFQATFLVLARKAASVRPRDLVGHWLYGVAYRTALKARTLHLKRRSREKQVDPMPDLPGAAPAPDVWGEVRPLLDRELSLLPAKYRSAVVLCDLEGQTHKEAARRLGCPEGTLSVRLSRARQLLARRLARRGAATAGAALAAVLTQNAAASVPAALVSSTVRAAAPFAAGHAAAGLVPAEVAMLTEGVLKTMRMTKFTAAVATIVLLGGGVLVCGMLALAQTGDEAPPSGGPAPQARERPQEPKGLKELQGEWKVLALEDDGTEIRGEALAKMRWVVKGSKLQATDDGENYKGVGTINLDPDKNPKHIDLLALEGKQKGQTIRGIYKLEKGIWTVCMRGPPARADPPSSRPERARTSR
jgi:RNA polymerase sigma-70 factor (ECF subfamily)